MENNTMDHITPCLFDNLVETGKTLSDLSIQPRASVATLNLSKRGHAPIHVMDEKQKGDKICYKATINPAREEEAVNGENGAGFHL
jgi:hypothetical protein